MCEAEASRGRCKPDADHVRKRPLEMLPESLRSLRRSRRDMPVLPVIADQAVFAGL